MSQTIVLPPTQVPEPTAHQSISLKLQAETIDFQVTLDLLTALGDGLPSPAGGVVKAVAGTARVFLTHLQLVHQNRADRKEIAETVKKIAEKLGEVAKRSQDQADALAAEPDSPFNLKSICDKLERDLNVLIMNLNVLRGPNSSQKRLKPSKTIDKISRSSDRHAKFAKSLDRFLGARPRARCIAAIKKELARIVAVLDEALTMDIHKNVLALIKREDAYSTFVQNNISSSSNIVIQQLTISTIAEDYLRDSVIAALVSEATLACHYNDMLRKEKEVMNTSVNESLSLLKPMRPLGKAGYHVTGINPKPERPPSAKTPPAQFEPRTSHTGDIAPWPESPP